MTYKYLCINSNSGFIAGNFVFQKKYQKTAGASIKSGVIYNALTGIFSTLIFLIINKFKIDVVPYSCVMAFDVCCRVFSQRNNERYIEIASSKLGKRGRFIARVCLYGNDVQGDNLHCCTCDF